MQPPYGRKGNTLKEGGKEVKQEYIKGTFLNYNCFQVLTVHAISKWLNCAHLHYFRGFALVACIVFGFMNRAHGCNLIG